MNRRSLLKVLAVTAVLPLATGCAITKAQVTAWGADVDSAVSAILAALGYTTLEATIKGYLAQFNTAVADWNGSSFTAALTSAAQDLEVALGDTALPAAYVAVADVAINVLVTLITQLGGGAAAPAAPSTAHTLARPAQVRYTAHVVYKNRAAAVAAFNQAAAQAGVAAIK
jgi:hypothetical protein